MPCPLSLSIFFLYLLQNYFLDQRPSPFGGVLLLFPGKYEQISTRPGQKTNVKPKKDSTQVHCAKPINVSGFLAALGGNQTSQKSPTSAGVEPHHGTFSPTRLPH